MTDTPPENRYTEEHEWARRDDDNPHIIWIGITDYAQGQLGDVVMVELPEVGEAVDDDDACGAVESPKSVSDVFAPLVGRIIEVNETLLDAPEIVNSSPYDDGWLFKLEIKDAASFDDLMDHETYASFVEGLE